MTAASDSSRSHTSPRTSKRDELSAELDALLASVDAPGRGEGRLYPALVTGISGDDVFLELGPRIQGIVPFAELETEPKVGETLQLVLTGRSDDLWLFSAHAAKQLAAWQDMEVGSLVKGTVIGLNKGGLELRLGAGVKAFLPASHVALNHVEDLASYANETLICEVIELEKDKQRVVVSRRAVLQEERDAQRANAVNEITPGAVVRGTVKRIEPFGAFVEIMPGIEGLLHVSNISHRRVENPDEVLKVGDSFEVQILKVEEGGRRIGLGKKQLEADPWDEAADKLQDEAIVAGTVKRIESFGAFVELFPGVEGLLHVSQLGAGRVNHAKEVVSVGQELSVRVQSFDRNQRRISLSLLDSRGAVLGSDESAAGEEIGRVVQEGQSRQLGTNLGSLFKQALEKKKSN